MEINHKSNSQIHMEDRHYPKLLIHGSLLFLAGLIGLYLAGMIPGFSPRADHPIYPILWLYVFIFSTAGLPSFVLKCYMDKRPGMLIYVLPMLLFILFAFIKLILLFI